VEETDLRKEEDRLGSAATLASEEKRALADDRMGRLFSPTEASKKERAPRGARGEEVYAGNGTSAVDNNRRALSGRTFLEMPDFSPET